MFSSEKNRVRETHCSLQKIKITRNPIFGAGFFIGAIIATTDYHAPFFSLYSFLFFLFLSYHTVCVFSSFLSRHFCLSLSLSFYVSVCLLQVYSSLVVQLAALVATYLSISLVCLPRRRREEKFSLSLSPSHTHTHTHTPSSLPELCVIFCLFRPSVCPSVRPPASRAATKLRRRAYQYYKESLSIYSTRIIAFN